MLIACDKPVSSFLTHYIKFHLYRCIEGEESSCLQKEEMYVENMCALDLPLFKYSFCISEKLILNI